MILIQIIHKLKTSLITCMLQLWLSLKETWANIIKNYQTFKVWKPIFKAIFMFHSYRIWLRFRIGSLTKINFLLSLTLLRAGNVAAGFVYSLEKTNANVNVLQKTMNELWVRAAVVAIRANVKVLMMKIIRSLILNQTLISIL